MHAKKRQKRGAEVKAVVFDIGGVLVKHRNQVFVQKILSYLPLKGNMDWKQGAAVEALRKFELGRISGKEFRAAILPFMRKKLSFGGFKRAWSNNRIFVFKVGVFRLLQQLKVAGYKTGIISNITELHYSFISKRYNFSRVIDALGLSFRVHARKPQKKIFGAVLRKLRLPARECVYIDDLQEFVDAARAIGFNAVRFKSLPKLKKSLQRLGVRV